MNEEMLAEFREKMFEKIYEDIKAHGFSVVNVITREDPLAYSYTVGLHKSTGHPELFIVGVYPNTAQNILTNAALLVKQGKKLIPGERYDGIIERLKFEVREYKDKGKFNVLVRIYEKEVPDVFQLVYPDADGRYPGEDSCNEGIVKSQIL